MSTQVQGRCPMCGGSLFLGSGGYVTCSRSDCPNPTAVSDLLTDHTARHHVVVLTDDTFVIEHPLRERLTGTLFSCGLHEALSNASGPPAKPGTYHVHGDGRSAAWQAVAS